MRTVPGSVMLFAAGFGTRMGALTADRPKPLVQVAGKALIDHALEQINAFGVKTIVANLHYHPDMIEAHLAGRNIRFSRELPDILETGGGLRAALPLLGDGPHFTMNTDAVWRGPNPLAQLADVWEDDHMDALLLCVPPENTAGHAGKGDFLIGPDGRLSRGPGLIYTGLQIIKPDFLHDIDENAFSLNVLWDRMLSAGRLYGTTYDGQWCDVGSPDGIIAAETMLNAPNV